MFFLSISCISFTLLCFDLYLHLSYMHSFIQIFFFCVRFSLCYSCVFSKIALEYFMCWSFVECALDPHVCFPFLLFDQLIIFFFDPSNYAFCRCCCCSCLFYTLLVCLYVYCTVSEITYAP